MDRKDYPDDREYKNDDDQPDYEGANRFGSNRTGGKTLTYVLIGLTVFVAGGIAFVGWNFIDSVEKRTGELKNFHTRADEAKVDTHRFDALNNDVDAHLINNPGDPELALQEAVFKLSPSEISFNKGLSHFDQSHWAMAEVNFTGALGKIPGEAKDKKEWHAFGRISNVKAFTASALERRAVCYNHLGKTDKALVDINRALESYPDYDQYLRDRADIYTALGQKKLAAADLSRAAELKRKGGLQQRKPDGSQR